jgi:hypothetical protein
MYKKYLSLVFGFIAVSSFAQVEAPKYSNAFLQIGVGAKALGLGGNVVALCDNSSSGYWNPAGLTRMNSFMEFDAMHAEYFAGISKYDYLSWAMPVQKEHYLGVTFIRFGVDNIMNTTQLIDAQGNVDYDRITYFSTADYAMLLSYAHKLPVEGLSIGGNLKIVYRHIGDMAQAVGFGIDAGLQYKLNDTWHFGLMARDLSSTFNFWSYDLDDATKQVFEDTGNELPENATEASLPSFILASGARFQLPKEFYISPEINIALTTDGRRNTLFRTSPIAVDPSFGMEVGWSKYVALRMGFTNFQWLISSSQPKNELTFMPTIGIGVAFKGIGIDYAFTDIGNQSAALYSHVFSLSFKLKQRKEKVESE